jgi:Tfp pilus assembly protein PilE
MHKMKQIDSGFGIVELIIIVAVIGIIGAGGYVFYTKYNKTAANNSSTTKSADTAKPAQTQPTTQPADPYAGWKSYTSPSLKFSFKYPSDWNLSSVSNNAANTSVTINVFSPEISTNKDDQGEALLGPSKGAALKIDVYQDSSFAGIDHYLTAGPLTSESSIESPVKATVDGNDAAQFDLKAIVDSFDTIFNKNGVTYSLKYINGSSPDYTKYKSVNTGVLATFKTNN